MNTSNRDHIGAPRASAAAGDLGTPAAWAVWVAGFLAASALYGLTANHGVQWQDSGVQQFRIVSGQIDNSLGLALAHPVQFWLGRVAIRMPGIAPAFAITLVSALAGAIAVANLAATISLITRSTLATLIATTALALSHTFWQHATHTESYTLFAMFLTGEWLCLAAFARSGKTRFLLLTVLLNGLGLATHMMAVLTLPANVVVFIWAIRTRKCSWRTASAGALFWLTGTIPYSALVLLHIIHNGDAAQVIHSALFGEYSQDVLNTRLSLRGMLLPVGYVAYNFPGMTVPLAIVGIYAACKRRGAPTWLVRTLLAELLVFAVFVFRFSVQDQYTFFFPVYLLLALFAAIGLTHTMAFRSPRFVRVVVALAAITALWTPVVYLTTASLLRSRDALKSMVANKPYRDGYRSFFVPWGVGDNHAQQLNDAVRDLAGADGLVLVEDSMQIRSLRYAMVVGELSDGVALEPAWHNQADLDILERRAQIDAALEAGRPVVLASRDRDKPAVDAGTAQWKRRGDLYVLEAINPPTATQAREAE